MLGSLKERIKTQLYNKCYAQYEKETAWQSDRYAAFLTKLGEPVYLEPSGREASLSKADEPAAGRDASGKEKNGQDMAVIRGRRCILFVSGYGILEGRAVEAFDSLFEEKESLWAAYADEDYVDDKGRRHSPWIKPVFSPDTLADSFYPGNIFAVRGGSLPEEMEGKDTVPVREARSFFLERVKEALKACGIRRRNGVEAPVGRLSEFLFHGYAQEGDTELGEPLPAPKDNAYTEWMRQEQAQGEGFSAEVFRMGVRTALEKRMLVSVIIPSKDNQDVLETCLSSLRRITAGIGYEILVVDNGSAPENKARLQAMSGAYGFRYLYEPMEFNFSRMCNIGAKEAAYDYLLFLNDDMEITQDYWLAMLYEKAALSHAGAVGAKLLYPGTDLIQHAGVTNLKVGPAHKLLKENDKTSYYHGKNRGVHDMLAVTAACLLVQRRKFDEAGGFCEEIAVSYNDVELCFGLYELGYYNIQRNDVLLYHHESLSRGDDNLSGDKWERLLTEKDRLYGRHPELKGKDPFYSPRLAEHFSGYLCNFAYDYERRDCYTKVKPLHGKEPLKWENNCLTVTVEHAGRERKLDLEEEKEALWIEGWSYVLGMDNCRYKRELILLREDGTGCRACVLTRRRPDVARILPEQKNVELAGFTCRIPREKLRAGRYRIGMLASDRCSGQKLYRKTDAQLEVDI